LTSTDKYEDFYGKTMVAEAYERGLQLRLIQPGKPNQNAYMESFNGRLRDECLNEQCPPAACPHRDQNSAAGIQQGTTEEESRRLDTPPIPNSYRPKPRR